MGRSDGQRGIDTKGRRRRGKEGCSPRYLFLSCLRFKRRATLHVQLTGCLPARFSRDSIVLCQAWRALCATWAGGDPQMRTKPLRFPLTFALFLDLKMAEMQGGPPASSAILCLDGHNLLYVTVPLTAEKPYFTRPRHDYVLYF